MFSACKQPLNAKRFSVKKREFVNECKFTDRFIDFDIYIIISDASVRWSVETDDSLSGKTHGSEIL